MSDTRILYPGSGPMTAAAERTLGAEDDHLLIDSSFVAEWWPVPGEYDHTCWVRVRVTAEHRRTLPPGLDMRIMDAIRDEWPHDSEHCVPEYCYRCIRAAGRART